MKLTDLEPRWVNDFGDPPELKKGVSFWCPHCVTTHGTRLAVFFDSPVCGSAPVDIKAIHRSQSENGHLSNVHVGRILWHREGTSFEDLTLTPSIDASAWGCWHGNITRGNIV